MATPSTYKSSLRQDTAMGYKGMRGEDAAVSGVRSMDRVTSSRRPIFGVGTNPKGQGASTSRKGA